MNEFLQCLLFHGVELVDCYFKDWPVYHQWNFVAPMVFVLGVFEVCRDHCCTVEVLLNLSHFD